MLRFLHEELKLFEDDSNVVYFPNPKIYKDVQQHRKLKTKAQTWGGIYGKGGGKFAGIGDVHDFGEPVDVDTAHSHFQNNSKHYDKFKKFGAAEKADINDYFKEEASVDNITSHPDHIKLHDLETDTLEAETGHEGEDEKHNKDRKNKKDESAPPVKPEDLVRSIKDLEIKGGKPTPKTIKVGDKDMTNQEFDDFVFDTFKRLGGDYSKNEASSVTSKSGDSPQGGKQSRTADLPDIASDGVSGHRTGMMGGNAAESNSHEFIGQPEAADEYDNLRALEAIAAELLRGESEDE